MAKEKYIEGLDSFAGRLNACFASMHPLGRGPWKNDEVAAGIAARGGGITCSESYLWQLRTGRRDNPTLKQIHALAEFFDVSTIALVGAREEAEMAHIQVKLLRFIHQHPWLEDFVLLLSRFNPLGRQLVVRLVSELSTVPGLSQTKMPRSRFRDNGKLDGDDVS